MAHNRPADLQVTKLALSSGEVAPGETVNASIVVDNQGDLNGTYEASLKLDDAAVQSRAVALNGGSSQTIVFTMSSDTVGEHKAVIGNMVATFTVKKPLSPAVFTISELNINPLVSNQGEDVAVSAVVKNTGDVAGVYKAVLNVDDVAVQTKEVTLNGGGSQTVVFSLAPDTAGQHQVKIGGLLGPLEVKGPSAPVIVAGASQPELNSFSVAPIYDAATSKLTYVRVAYQMNATRDSSPDTSLMLTVFRDGGFLEQVPLFTLSQLQADGKTGELSYIPSVGWELGQYTFRAELYQGESLVQDKLSPLTITPGAATRTVSLWILGAIIGGATVIIAIVIACILYYRRDMMRA
jgi:hypothetical protein